MTEEQKQENRIRIGGQIAAIRNKKGLSIRELAEACGVSFANIYKIEKGKYNVSIDILGKICEALNCRIDLVDMKTEVRVKNELPNKGDIITVIGKRTTSGATEIGNQYEVIEAWERELNGKVVKFVRIKEKSSGGNLLYKTIKSISYDWEIIKK